jgi:hypothetical protein
VKAFFDVSAKAYLSATRLSFCLLYREKEIDLAHAGCLYSFASWRGLIKLAMTPFYVIKIA